MITSLISRIVILLLGSLYPAYASYKAVKTKNVKDYVKWMMYWIVYAVFTCAETVADIFISWLPFYYEFKIGFVLWMLSPATQGSSLLYRHFVHPHLKKREQEIDNYISMASDQGCATLISIGSRGLSLAANAVITSKIADQIKSSIGIGDETTDNSSVVNEDNVNDQVSEADQHPNTQSICASVIGTSAITRHRSSSAARKQYTGLHDRYMHFPYTDAHKTSCV